MPNHWSNEEKTHEYIRHIILPYLKVKRKELCLPESFPALAISDFIKGQTTPSTYQLLEQNNIYPISIPANCTDRLQPMDLRRCQQKFKGSAENPIYGVVLI